MQVSRDNRFLIIAVFVVAIVTIFPFAYWQEDVRMQVYDNMDSNVVWVKMLLDNNACWASPNTIIEQALNGVPRSSLFGVYDLSLFIFWLFGIFWGYAINKLIIAVIATVGMYLLLKKHVLPISTPNYIPILVAFLFGSLPFWSFSGTVAGVPLAFWAFFNLRNGDKRLINWLSLILYGFYSSLILTGFFVLLAMTCVFLYDLIRLRKFDKYLFLGLALLSITYIISHWSIFYSHLMPTSGYVSHRSEMQMMGNREMGFSYFWYALQRGGPSHLIIMQIPIMLPLACFTLGLMFIKKNINKLFVFVFSAILLSTLFISILNLGEVSDFMSKVYAKSIPLDLARVQWLTPTLWYIFFALTLGVLLKYFPRSKYILLLLIVLQYANIKRPTSSYYKDSNSPLTFNQYYSPEELETVKKYIGKDPKDYRVICIGLAPAVPQFSGFYTLDAYIADYPLEYKHRFAEVIHKEIEKSPYVYNLFMNWGSRCYAYSTELMKVNELRIKNDLPKVTLDYDFEKLKELGAGKDVYIISATEIEDAPIELLKEFKSPDWYWHIRLYKVS